jgi:hypothetical protein
MDDSEMLRNCYGHLKTKHIESMLSLTNRKFIENVDYKINMEILVKVCHRLIKGFCIACTRSNRGLK